MKNPQPFITTDELRKEFYEDFPPKCPDCGKTGANCYGECTCSYHVSKNVIERPKKIADFWLQKMSEHKERLIKEVSGIPDTEPQYQDDGYDAGLKYMKAEVLRRLQSV